MLTETEQFCVEKVIIPGKPERGPCGGVKMAIVVGEFVLDLVDGREPVYTNFKVVNNDPVMRRLKSKGLVDFNNNWNLVPDNSIAIYSAHGVPPSFLQIAKDKGLATVNTTCQRVTRVGMTAKRAVEEGKHIGYIGVKGHPETVGVMGQVDPSQITLLEKPEDVESIPLPTDRPILLLSQTTLSTDEFKDTQTLLLQRYPNLLIPHQWMICNATDIRQGAVKEIEPLIDGLIVAGTPSKVIDSNGQVIRYVEKNEDPGTITDGIYKRGSHNSDMLREVVEQSGKPAILRDTPQEIPPDWFKPSMRVIGLTSGASVPDELMYAFVKWMRQINPNLEVEELPPKHNEEDTYKLPWKDLKRLVDHLLDKYGTVSPKPLQMVEKQSLVISGQGVYSF